MATSWKGTVRHFGHPEPAGHHELINEPCVDVDMLVPKSRTASCLWMVCPCVQQSPRNGSSSRFTTCMSSSCLKFRAPLTSSLPGPAVAPPTPDRKHQTSSNCALDIECQLIPGSHPHGGPKCRQAVSSHNFRNKTKKQKMVKWGRSDRRVWMVFCGVMVCVVACEHRHVN